mgnify:CR=1 FL=1
MCIRDSSITDKSERQKCVQAIISYMGQMNPHLRDIPDYKHKLWDHLFIMSEFKLEVDSPYEKPSREKLAEKLGVDAEVAGVLIDEGYTSLDEIADAESDVLSKIEEFDSEMVGELQERAQDAQLVKALNDSEATEILLGVEGVDDALANSLVDAEITTVDALAELAIVELLEIQDVGNDNASAIIIAAREQEGWFD